MRVVTLVRKPIGSSSIGVCCAGHGAGPLNIDGTRIGGGSEGGVWPTHVGRWPTNAIFQHQPSCEVVGKREVRTGVAVRENSGGKTIFSEAEKPPMANMSYGEGGKEAILDWRCVEGCPVPDLDIQSGTSTSKAHTRNNAGSWKVRKKGNRTASVETSHSDSGGASRFFKQVKS